MIKPFGLRDLRQLNRLQRSSISLDIRQTSPAKASPTRTALKGFLTLDNRVAMTWLYGQGDDTAASGFAQVLCDPGARLWHLASLAPDVESSSLTASDEARAIWQELLGHLTQRARSHGIEQIHAHPLKGSAAADILAHSGFCRACTEHLFSLNRSLPYANRPADLHTFVLTGRWQLGELYRQSVPSGVRAVLQTSSLSPVEEIHLPHLSWHVAEWIAVEDETPYAYFKLTRTNREHWLYVLVRPERRGDILNHIAYVAGLDNPGHARPLYCIIPDYAIGAAWLLRQLGFGEMQEHTHLVRQLAVKVSSPVFATQVPASLQYRDAGTTAISSQRRA